MSKPTLYQRKLAAKKQAEKANAQARRRAAREFASQALTLRIKLMDAQDGDDATELLACLAVVIGTPCEAGARQFGHAPAWVRQLHGALRSILSMCERGYRWDSTAALALSRAVELAIEERPELDAEIFAESWLEANGLCTQILSHSVTPDAIAA